MVNLVKGQKVSLTKEGGDLNELVVGLGWDVNTSGGAAYDLDAAIIVCRNGKCMSSKDIVYYGNTSAYKGAIKHTGDNLTGAGDGDDESIIVKLNQLPAEVDKLVITVNIYRGIDKHQDFGQVRNAFVRIYNKKGGTEIIKYSLTESYAGAVSMLFGELYRHDGDWKFNPIGAALNAGSISEIAACFK